MRVLVDTSVWADFFNEQPTPESVLLARLIEDEAELVTCGLVVAEFLQGIRRTSTLPGLERHGARCRCEPSAPPTPPPRAPSSARRTSAGP